MKNVLLASPGLTAQCLGAVALVAGFGVLLGLGAALLCLGVILIIGGTIMELPSDEAVEVIEEVNDGSWAREAA